MEGAGASKGARVFGSMEASLLLIDCLCRNVNKHIGATLTQFGSTLFSIFFNCEILIHRKIWFTYILIFFLQVMNVKFQMKT